MNSVSALANYIEEALKVVQRSRLRPELYSDIVNRYSKLFNNIMDRKLPYGRLELEDFNRELDRLFDLEQAYARRSSPQYGDEHSKAQPFYDQALKLILSHKRYTGESKSQLRELFEVSSSLISKLPTYSSVRYIYG